MLTFWTLSINLTLTNQYRRRRKTVHTLDPGLQRHQSTGLRFAGGKR
jgi:hypothetical protein